MDTTPSPLRRERYTLGLVFLILGLVGALIAVFAFPPSILRTLASLAAPQLAALCIAVWWMLSRTLSWRLKFIGLGLAVLATLILVFMTVHPVPMFAFIWGVPAVLGLLLLAFAASRGWRPIGRTLLVAGAFALGVVPWLLARSDGATGQLLPSLHWVWNEAPAFDTPVAGTAAALNEPLVVTATDWPGFRGAQRNGVVAAPIVDLVSLDWQGGLPTELWRVPVGRGWSSVAVVGGLVYTQEQVDEEERVLCLDATNGSRQWVHVDAVRFDESMGGVGPRSTPLVHDGRLYALGATGVLNCLDARSGERLWSADVASGSESAPEWGFASSPLIVGDLVYVSPAGIGGVRMMAFDRLTGAIAWRSTGFYSGYGSAEHVTLGGVPQILLFDFGGLISYEPASGETLWEYEWLSQSPKVVQPHQVDEETVIVGMGYGQGTRSLRVNGTEGGWNVTENWITKRFKPKFNDFVIRDGFIYGLDEGILSCVDLATGKRLWKGGRFGYGQLLLVDETLLIVSESGEVVLVEATPSGEVETSRFEALEGKTWNHPAMTGGRLFVRNAAELVCYDVSGTPERTASRAPAP